MSLRTLLRNLPPSERTTLAGILFFWLVLLLCVGSLLAASAQRAGPEQFAFSNYTFTPSVTYWSGRFIPEIFTISPSASLFTAESEETDPANPARSATPGPSPTRTRSRTPTSAFRAPVVRTPFTAPTLRPTFTPNHGLTASAVARTGTVAVTHTALAAQTGTARATQTQIAGTSTAMVVTHTAVVLLQTSIAQTLTALALPSPTAEPGKLVFSKDLSGDGFVDLVRMASNGAQAQIIRQAGVDLWLNQVWQAGSRLVYEQAEGSPAVARLRLMNLDGSGDAALAGQPDGENTLAAWSPDGQWILFANGPAGSRELYLIHPDGTGLAQLTVDAFDDYAPAWGSDSSRIVFVSNRSGAKALHRLYVGDLTASPPIPTPDPMPALDLLLSGEVSGARRDAVSGDWVFARNDGTKWNLYRIDNEDWTQPVLITGAVAFDAVEPAWSGEGRWIYFVGIQGGQRDIYLISPAGGAPFRITADSMPEYRVYWAP